MAERFQLSGLDHEGNSLSLNVTRREFVCLSEIMSRDANQNMNASQCMVDIWMIFTISKVGSFIMVPGRTSSWCSCCRVDYDAKDGNIFVDSCGLRIECIEPMKKWSITFNGFLQWKSLTQVHHFTTDSSPDVLAASLSKERWTLKAYNKVMDWFYRDETYYSQWGELSGVVRHRGRELMMCLRGPRNHLYGSVGLTLSRPCSSWIIYTEKYHMIQLEVVCWQSFIKKYHMGFVSFPNGEKTPITTSNLTHSGVVPDLNNRPKFKFVFKAGGTKYKVECNVTSTGMLPPNTDHIFSNIIFRTADVKVNGMNGMALCTMTYLEKSADVFDTISHSPAPLFQEFLVLNRIEADEYVVPLSSPLCTVNSFVGGKACQLAFLYQNQNKKYSVKNAVCISVNAFKRFLVENHHAMSFIKRMKVLYIRRMSMPGSSGSVEVRETQKMCAGAQQVMREGVIADVVKFIIKDQLAQSFGKDFERKKFAVRSSAIGEDGTKLSGAGHMETTLNVQGLDEVLIMMLRRTMLMMFMTMI
ncbi:hypothetical protein HELRODRAFT_165728 [Helobdella robusta]|uniref:Pyruvate phosphate dikinase AMP/ATP-binding domain-containing protein n=1 Tax=Helobdella robusta TaxID=6412 RepID=T1EX78_HELRO|nr:hypothetical protein HELRODRAFT_165728 [Helobdella robusta]ESN91672.1 hypothetical protein HELRODRAFT_165728 [Helobdella robusta]